MQPAQSQIRLQIFVSVANSLISKWPVQTKNDYQSIAKTANALTDILLEEYNKGNSGLLEE
jgi:hypothetical protein